MIRRLFSLRKPAGAFGLLLALILIFGFAGYAAAVPAQPHQFYGQVSVGGLPAPQGVEVAAKIGGVQYASTTTDAQGRYGYSPVFYVPADDPDTPTKEGGRNGDVVEFYVAGVLAGSHTFEIGGVTQLNLVIEALPDTTPPVLTRTKPASVANLPYRAADYTGDTVFEWQANEDLDTAATPTAVFAAAGAPSVNGTVAFPDARTVRVVPHDDLLPGTSYTLTVTGIKDTAGNEAQVQVEFTTRGAPVTLQELRVKPSSLTLTVGETAQLTVTAVYSDGSETVVTDQATYTSEDENVVTVSAGGLVSAVAAGQTVVTATYGGKEAQATVTVQAAPVGPAPVVTNINPNNAVAGKPDRTVTVTGQNFRESARVVLCREGQPDTVVTAVYRSTTELTFTVPMDLAPGLYMVKVKNPDGQQSAEHVLLTLYAGEAPRAQAFPGATGSEPGEIRPDGAVRVEVPVQVAQAYPNALVVIRVDDPDGRAMLAAVEGPLPANTEVKFSASFNLPGKAGTYAVKAFVWDGWQTMNVLTPAYEGAFAAGDTAPPALVSTEPADGATGVPVDKVIKVTFSEPVVEGPQFGAISLARNGDAVAASCSLSGTVLSIRPQAALAYETRYTVTVPAEAVKDVAGNLLASPVTFSFTTAAAPDTTPPTVASTDPENGAADVPVDKTITVTFSEDVQAGAAYGDVVLKDVAGNAVAVEKSISGRVLTLDPVSDLAAGTAHTVTIPAGAVKDAAGNALAGPYTFGFTTRAAPAPALELKVGNVSGAPGSTVEVPIILTSQGQVAGFEFHLAYGSDLMTYQSVDEGQLTSAWSVQGNVLEPGKVKVVAYHPNLEPAASGTGSVAVLTFQVAANAASGASCDLTLQNVVLSDANGA